MKKKCFKSLVKSKVKLKAIKFLQSLQSKHTKTKDLVLSDKMQPYLTSAQLSLFEKKYSFTSVAVLITVKITTAQCTTTTKTTTTT